MKTGAVIQTRMGSTRFPGKAMLLLSGKPVLQHIVERLSSIKNMPVITATSTNQSDDPIADFCHQKGYNLVRGDLEDVLQRYLLTANQFQLDVIVRITGDSPLIDPLIVETMVEKFYKGNFDYYSNLRPRTLPRGFGCEIFKSSLLKAAFQDKQSEDAGEYVVIPYLNRHLGELKVGNFRLEHDYSTLRLTLDEPADYELIRIIYEELYTKNNLFSYRDVISFLDKQPQLKMINAHVRSKNA